MEQFNISGLDVFKNSRMKYYIDSSGRRVPYEFMVCNRQIFSDKGFEESDASKAAQKELDYRAAMQELQHGSSYSDQHYKPEPRSHEELLDASRRRARRKIFDYLICNEWDYFLTLTLDGAKIGRDYDTAIKKLNSFLGNRVRRHGLKYIGVPEYHKRGGVHFHFAVSGGGFHLVDSGTVSIDGRKKPVKIATAKRLGVSPSDCHTVYNVTDWTVGFSTAIAVHGARGALAGYLCKELSKSEQKTTEKIGGRWYLSGGKLCKPVVQVFNSNFDDVTEFSYDVNTDGGAFKVVKLNAKGDIIK